MSEVVGSSQELEARPGAIARASRLIHEGLGGRRGDRSERKGLFSGGAPIKVVDSSRDNSWTHVRNQTWLTSPSGNNFEIRAEDGGSGSDDPEQYLVVINRDTQETWEHYDEGQPEWVQEALASLSLAQTELGSSED